MAPLTEAGASGGAQVPGVRLPGPATGTLAWPLHEGDLPDSTLALAWPQDARSPAVAAFVRAACTVAAAAHPRAEPVMRSAATWFPAATDQA